MNEDTVNSLLSRNFQQNKQKSLLQMSDQNFLSVKILIQKKNPISKP